MLLNMYKYQKEMEDRLTSFVALAPIGHTTYTENAFYDMYSRYWRSFKGHTHTEMWGKGYQ